MPLELLDRPRTYTYLTPIAAASAAQSSELTLAFDPKTCVHRLIAEQTQRTPEALAVADGHYQLNYSELNTRANQVAHYLRACGVGVETLVGVCMERSVDLVVACLAILKAGGAYVPLDPAYPIERLAFMLTDACVPIVLTHERLRASLAPYVPEVICLDTDWPRLAQEVPTELSSRTSIENLAYVIYTSGSTGQPKGVQIEHRGLLNLLIWHQRAFAISANDRATLLAGPAFDASVWELWPYLTAGASIHIPDEAIRLEPARLRDWLLHQAITVCFLPTPLAERVIDLVWPDESSLRLLLTGGDQLTRHPKLGLPFALINNYGPTENSVVSTSGPVLAGEQHSTLPDIGRPIDNVRIYILDARLQPVPVGVPGELCINSIGLARGYLNRPDLTAEKFVPDPFAVESDARMYRTGDLARYRIDGTIEFLGRMDHQVKIRGFRIELGEIEAVLRQHYALREAVVVAREVAGSDSHEKYLVAYVVLDRAGELKRAPFVAELRAFLQAKLPEYMVPGVFVMLDKLPLTPNGKVDRQALPMPTTNDTASDLAAMPRTPDEAVLTKIWAEVLNRPSVGIHDDFFALGGHSLLAARAVALVNAAFNCNLSLRLLFEAPTIAAFAQAVRNDTVSSACLGSTALAAEVVLDPAITAPAITAPATTRQPLDTSARAIFLTGATGFLGAFLLHELLTQTNASIYCLVRGANDAEAGQRLQQTLDKYQIERKDWRRIIPVAGDLRAARLGLSAQTFQHLATTIDVIYHVGAQVHYLHPYSALKMANVHGTVEILRLSCQQRLKPVHYVSTIGVAMTSSAHAREDDELASCESSKGYDQSKWVAEGIVRLARARGLPVTIYRPGRIGAHSCTGVGNPDDFFTRLLAGCIQLGFAPNVPLLENLIPVDYAAQAIVHLSQQPRLTNKTFHLLNPQPVEWPWVIGVAQQLGYPLQLVPYTAWRNALAQAAPFDTGQDLHTLLTLVPEDQAAAHWINYARRYIFDTSNTVDGLAGSGFHCPSIDATQVVRLLDQGVQQGWFAAPRLAHNGAAEPKLTSAPSCSEADTLQYR